MTLPRSFRCAGRRSFFLNTAVLLLGGLLAGCGHIDVSEGGNPNRVVRGTVQVAGGLPQGAEVVVRVIAPMPAETPRSASADVPVTTRPAPAATERVLGEFAQTLAAGTSEAVPFTIEFVADDAVMRRGLNLDARVSIGGKLRYRTINAHVVTLSSVPFPQHVAVQAVQ